MGYGYVRTYMEYLQKHHGLSVAVKDFMGFTVVDPQCAWALGAYCVHQSPYCLMLKSSRALWDKCQSNNRALMRRCQQDGRAFTGMCYAGYSEIVVPVIYQGRAVAAVCAGGFALNAPRSQFLRARLAAAHGLDPALIDQAYHRSVSPMALDMDTWLSALGLLADFCLLLYDGLARSGQVSPQGPLGGDYAKLSTLACAIEYVHTHFDQDIRLSDVAAFCGCSQSHLSHLFGKHMPMTFAAFVVKVRVQRARGMLMGGLPVSRVAAACGFSDPNYFSAVFKRATGHTPTGYAKRHREGMS